jgi:hypothetical protein
MTAPTYSGPTSTDFTDTRGAGTDDDMFISVPRFASFDISSLRSASGAGQLAWLGRSVTLLRVNTIWVVSQAKTDSEKTWFLESATSKDVVLLAWPSQRSQDIYVVDDLKAARAAVHT